MSEFQLRAMRADEWDEVAAIICDSTRAWYLHNRNIARFPGGPATTRLFCEVYEALDPGCCVVAEDAASGRLAGSCFYHPRETHVSVGIMNAHPDYFGRGVARRLLGFINEYAEREGKPVRLVSSAMNLDSFSLYSRAGFVPRMTFATMAIDVPTGGMNVTLERRVRPARMDDVPAMAELEMRISHIRREKDYRFFIENAQRIWHISVIENTGGGIDGFLASVSHPASNMLGPGVARTEEAAAALIAAELGQRRGQNMVLLVPAECAQLMKTMYAWGARNCEIHLAQTRGRFDRFTGVVLPTFMPETG